MAEFGGIADTIIVTSYVTWAVILFIMRSSLLLSIIGMGLIELANLLAYYCYFPPSNLPMNTVAGFFTTSLVYASFNMLGLSRVLKVYRVRSSSIPSSLSSLKCDGGNWWLSLRLCKSNPTVTIAWRHR